jgi:hypothetical protein
LRENVVRSKKQSLKSVSSVDLKKKPKKLKDKRLQPKKGKKDGKSRRRSGKLGGPKRRGKLRLKLVNKKSTNLNLRLRAKRSLSPSHHTRRRTQLPSTWSRVAPKLLSTSKKIKIPSPLSQQSRRKTKILQTPTTTKLAATPATAMNPNFFVKPLSPKNVTVRPNKSARKKRRNS